MRYVSTAYLNLPPQVTALVSRLTALLAAPPAKPAVPGPAVTRLDDSNTAVAAGPTRPWRLYDRLTSDNIETIVRLYAAGTIHKDLAAKFNISVSSIQRVLRDHGGRQ
ncbi:helix-turn-helix domain-containing protein [Glycomyces sp. NEAU-S30]|uniref:Helix-turn-helix domain-containing protein n=2 Tax=Glycomyces niveus TaxID=2820287 RepID=A0ABS3U3U0_9ACTN|nr:helix-turn-helix domain-containing protein [Glycomyces sp. NEAU-S30]